MRSLPRNKDPNLLVGFETNDDAGVYRLTADLALVTTADIITPPVDDPYLFGQIAAANAISDIYAMGGRPVTCINLAAFPSGKLPAKDLHQIVAGALSKITEAGAVLAGGHTIEDDEPKFGLAVTGVVHPDKIWRNAGAQPGDALILTKPIGSGVLFNANLKGWVSPDSLQACLAALTELNRGAVEALERFDVHAGTDVTGFGLAGHAFEMARGSAVTLEITFDQIPTMTDALKMYRKGMSTGVNKHNRALVEAQSRFDPAMSTRRREIVFDPQTSGGLLVALPQSQADAALKALHAQGLGAARMIGTVTAVAGDDLLVFK